jgi:hypothetical protein
MVHCGIVTTYTKPIDATKDYFAIIRDIYCHEAGSIPYRRKWCKDGSSLVTICNIDNSIARAF